MTKITASQVVGKRVLCFQSCIAKRTFIDGCKTVTRYV